MESPASFSLLRLLMLRSDSVQRRNRRRKKKEGGRSSQLVKVDRLGSGDRLEKVTKERKIKEKEAVQALKERKNASPEKRKRKLL